MRPTIFPPLDICRPTRIRPTKPSESAQMARDTERAARLLERNAEAYHLGDISYAEHSRRNSRIWGFIQGQNPPLSYGVLAILRRMPR